MRFWQFPINMDEEGMNTKGTSKLETLLLDYIALNEHFQSF